MKTEGILASVEHQFLLKVKIFEIRYKLAIGELNSLIKYKSCPPIVRSALENRGKIGRKFLRIDIQR